jgi:type VI secretion system protein ImpL
VAGDLDHLDAGREWRGVDDFEADAMSSPFDKMPWLPWAAMFGALSATLLLFRKSLGLSLLFVILILVILGLVISIALLIRQLRQAAAAEAIEKTITTQADADIERSTPGQLAEVQGLKDDLLNAIAQLKTSAKKTGSDALAKLPWYMVIGPAGAGKSELLKRSGLEFPLREASGDARAVQGVGGTRSFSWWLAQEAVLLDMAGRTLATAAFDDSGDWVSFLETLRKQRPEKPINGVVVTVALDQIADHPEARIDSIARGARERIEELVEHLGVVFPVYLMFTRVDRVAGFAEYFEDLDAAERRSPWGATLPMKRARTAAAEALFDEEFGLLLGALSERRIPRMNAAGAPADRARAFAFPLQFERVRGNLRRFVRTLFEPQANAEPPLFRGFYFSAAAQTGEPVDRVLQPAVRSLGLTVRAPEAAPAARGGAWFVRDFFTEVLFPDAALATASRGAQGRLKRGEQVMVGIYGLVLLVLTLLFTGLSCSNHGVVDRAKRASVDVANRVTDETALIDNLRTLDGLREAADEVDRIDRRVPMPRAIGAWAGGSVRDPAITLWMRRTAQYVLKPAAQRMEDSLRARVAGEPGTFLSDYYRFRAWRLLTRPGDIDVEDADALAREVMRALEDRLELGGTDAEGRRAYPDLVLRQMQFLARHPRELAAIVRDYIGEQDRSLVAQMAPIVRDSWAPGAFYAEMIADASRHLEPVGFEKITGPTSLMRGARDVPGAFTKNGWASQVQPRAAWYGRMVQRDAVMADAFGGRPPNLERQLQALYAGDVTGKWVAFLEGVTYSAPGSMDLVADQLAQLAKGDAPLFKLLREARDQTQGLAVAGTPLERIGLDFRMLREFFEPPGSLGERTQSWLGEIARKLPGRGASPSTLRESLDAQYLTMLAAAQQDIAKLGPAAPLQSLVALLRPPPDQTNGVFELVTWCDGLGDNYSDSPAGPVVAQLLRSPVDAARRAVRERGLGPRFAAAWQSDVLQRFQNDLAGRYPFDPTGPDASYDAFAACFSGEGYFWTFFQQYLAPFLNEDGTAKGADAPPVSEAMVTFVTKAHAIRQAFFAAGPAPALSFTASATPPPHDPGIVVRWVALDCGGVSRTYTMGPPRDEQLAWPGPDPAAGAALRAQAAPPDDPKKKRRKDDPTTIAVAPIGADGPWGLFRLLDRAQTVTTTAGRTNATWALTAANGARIRMTWDLRVQVTTSPFERGFLRVVPPATP